MSRDEILPLFRAAEAEFRTNLASSKAIPKLLYHYTTLEGMMGIIDSECLWATDVRYLNEARELEYSHDLVIDRLNRWTSGNGYEQEKSIISSLVNGFDMRGLFNIFSVSFSEER